MSLLLTLLSLRAAYTYGSLTCGAPPCGSTAPCYDTVSCSFGSTSACSDQPVASCEYLCQLFQSTRGASWTSNANWGVGSISSWYGIQIAAVPGGSKVLLLNLNNNNLRGTLPSSVGCLQPYRLLFLGNRISGTLPEHVSIPRATALQEYSAASNRISGTLPTGLLDHTDAYFYKFDSNRLSGSVLSFSSVSWIKWLFLANNHFSGLQSVHPEIMPTPPHSQPC